HTLMNYTNLPLDEIYNARLRLEAIGLLQTYETEMEEQKVYIYELQQPFTPREFFHDDMLSQLLYHHIGEKVYRMLKNHYCQEENHESLKQVTASFRDVFKTHQSFKKEEPIQAVKEHKTGTVVEDIDFTWIEQMLSAKMIPARNVLTGANKRLILQMMDLYDLAEYEIEKSLL